ncbi:AI-2E family transporter [Pseudonocardia saturnea]
MTVDGRGAVRPPPDAAVSVPHWLRVGGALGWRLLVVVGALAVLGVVLGYLAPVVVPVAIALLLAALLSPAVGWLVEKRVPRAVATTVVLLGGLALVGGGLTFVVVAFVEGLPDLVVQLSAGLDALTRWLIDGPLRISEQQLRGAQQQAVDALGANQATLTMGALTTAATLGELVTGILLVVFTLIFFLHGGLGIWRFALNGVPEGVRARVDVAGRRGLAALVSYVRATAVVAVVDAVAIGVGLAVLNVPLALPLATLVFLGAFVPIVGAVIAGSASVLVALVAQGPVPALIVLAIIIAVMQLEGHVLQPLLLGRAVKLHPLAVVLVIAAGLLVAGIPGALLSVPLLAVLNSGIRSLRSPADEHVDPEDVRASEPEETGPAEPHLDRQPDLAGVEQPG